MRYSRTILCASLLAGAVLAAPGGPEALAKPELLDYALVQRTLPKLSELGDEGTANVHELHLLVEELRKEPGGENEAQIRAKIRTLLEKHIGTKSEIESVLREVLRMPSSGRSDEEVFRKVNNEELRGINWDDVTFRKAIKDLSGALGVPIRMQHSVVQMNRVTMRFNKAPASTILGSLCNYFQLRYVIHSGEIVIYKRITPTEDRFLEYQKKHPDVRLKYWDREDATGKYKKEEK